MNDSDVHESLAAKRERNHEQRIAAIKRWVEYVKSEPASKWGKQLNRLVDAQLAAAREADLPAEHHRRVERGAGEWDEETG